MAAKRVSFSTLREQYRLNLLEGKILTNMFGPKAHENGECFTVKNFIAFTVQLSQLRLLNLEY